MIEENAMRRPLATGAESPVEEEEQRLLRAAQEGDVLALAALMERHLPKVASLCARFLRDRDDAEDAVQETLLRACRNLGRFRGEASVRTWLLRIAVNVCKNKRGDSWRRRVELTEETCYSGPAEHTSAGDARALAEETVAREERDRALHQALEELPEKLRVPILLHFFEELSGAEVAAVLGWNPSTVWTRIYAGCRALRKKLGTDWLSQ